MCKEKEVILSEQIEEAMLRMRKIGLLGHVISDFANGRKLYRSEHAILYWLNDLELQMVRSWEEQTGNVVYHVIKNQMEFGPCYSFLFVSKHKDAWKIDRNDIHEGCPFVYVKNVDDEGSSVYGSIGIRPVFGGVLRIE